MPSLQVDSHFTVVEATLKGYVKWKKYSQQGTVSYTDVSNPDDTNYP